MSSKKTWVQADQVIEDGTTDIGHTTLANPRHQIETAEGTHRQRQHQQQEQPDGLIELVRGAGHEALIHQQADAWPIDRVMPAVTTSASNANST